MPDITNPVFFGSHPCPECGTWTQYRMCHACRGNHRPSSQNGFSQLSLRVSQEETYSQEWYENWDYESA